MRGTFTVIAAAVFTEMGGGSAAVDPPGIGWASDSAHPAAKARTRNPHHDTANLRNGTLIDLPRKWTRHFSR